MIKGYDKLSDNAKRFFDKMYKKHMAVIEQKENWIPVKVVEHKTYLKVHFNNGEWLHYYANGTWG